MPAVAASREPARAADRGHPRPAERSSSPFLAGKIVVFDRQPFPGGCVLTTSQGQRVTTERKRSVSVWGTITTVSVSPRGAAPAVSCSGGRYPLLRRLFKPTRFELCGLMIAVMLWGFGSKLSAYFRHSTDAQRITVAKLWVDPDASLAAAKKLHLKSQLVTAPQALSSSVSWLPRLDRAAVCFIPTQTRGIPSLHSPTLPRSPPPAEFHTA